jgi:hypothetical protein
MDLKTFKFGFVFRKHEKINYLFITSSLVTAPPKVGLSAYSKTGAGSAVLQYTDHIGYTSSTTI